MKKPNVTIGQDIIQLAAEIDEFKNKWRTWNKLPDDRLQQLRRSATVESVGASIRIAGAKLTNAEVEALLWESEQLLSGQVCNESAGVDRSRDEAAAEMAGPALEVKGYAEAMELVVRTHQDLELTDEHIHRLHGILFQHCAENGGSEVESPELQDLLRWTTTAFNEASMHPLLIVAVFNALFLAIHPFQNGNGRLSRILMTQLLLRGGYDYLPYSSLDAVIEKDKLYYQKALQRTQSTLDDDAPSWQPWFAFFLRCLKAQTIKLAPAIEYHQASDSKELPQLSMDVLVLLSQHRSLTITQIAELTGAKQSELEPRLRELTDAGHIQDHDEGESYRLPG